MKAMKYAPAHDDDKWKIQVVKDLLEVKWNTVEIENMEIENDENDEILMTICSSWFSLALALGFEVPTKNYLLLAKPNIIIKLVTTLSLYHDEYVNKS